MMRNTVRAGAVLLVAAAIGACVAGAQTRNSKNRAGETSDAASVVRRVLDAQVAAWNRGDIDGFMDGYARSEDTTFVSGDTVTRGWRTVLERYKRRYDSREKMGTLAFTELETKSLVADAALVTGRWQLTRIGEQEAFARGRFTLVFRKTEAGWRIVHDHTSSAE